MPRDAVYVRSCQHCGAPFDNVDKAKAEETRDKHESVCPVNPDNTD
jgi:hypothetical protein